MWVGKPSRGQNLYCKGQQSVTDAYRKGYDAIRWDNNDDEEEMAKRKGGKKPKGC